MRTTHDWMKEYCAHGLDAKEAARLLTMAGVPIEEVRPSGEDFVFVAEITANRPDLLSVAGIARELAALTGARFALPRPSLKEGAKAAARLADARVAAPDLCPRYTARVITGVRVGPSPEWLARRLEQVGLRPINNVVDVTNYALMECGQPLHAFDLNRLEGGEIVVRRAAAGETLTAIDGRSRALTPDMLVIADARRPVALAGIMGGLDTEVGANTTDVLLESAHFAGPGIRRTARALAMSSEASHRFERGIDPLGVAWASDRAAALIAELGGGTVAQGMLDVWAAPFQPRQAPLRPARLARVLGLEIPRARIKEILAALEFTLISEDAERLVFAPPSFRGDVSAEVDLIEEVARINGYDRIPEVTGARVAVGRVSKDEIGAEQLRRNLAGWGYCETVSTGFTTAVPDGLISPWTERPAIEFKNLLRRDENLLRRSILPDLLKYKSINADRGLARVELFELGKVYLARPGEKQPLEQLCLAILDGGDFLELKGAVEQLLEQMGVAGRCQFAPEANPFFAAGYAARILLRGQKLGVMGQAAPRVAEQYGCRVAPCLAELNADLLIAEATLESRFSPLPSFPAALRDLAVVVAEKVVWREIEECVRAVGGRHLEAATFFDLYRGKQVPPGRKSVAFSLCFRAPDRTLTSEEVDAATGAIVAALRDRLQAVLRQ